MMAYGDASCYASNGLAGQGCEGREGPHGAPLKHQSSYCKRVGWGVRWLFPTLPRVEISRKRGQRRKCQLHVGIILFSFKSVALALWPVFILTDVSALLPEISLGELPFPIG